MDTARLQGHQKWIREELERCVAFWLEHGMDPVNGGVYTCLDRTGEVFSTEELHRLSGGALRQPRRGRAAVFHRYRRGKAPAPAPLLLLRGVLRPGQRGILRRYRPAGAPGARPPGLRPVLGPEPRNGRPHRPGAQDHPRDPHRTRLRHPHDPSERHRRAAAGGPGAQGAVRGAFRPVCG